MQAIVARRSCVRVRCSAEKKECDMKKLNDQVQGFRKTLVAEKKKLEDMRSSNFRSLHGALKQMVDDEVQFVRSLCMRAVPAPEKPVEVVSSTDGTETEDDE